MRCNEISVERLHAFATSEGNRVGNISPAALSIHLRERCLWHETWGFALSELAEECFKVRNTHELISAFQFDRHPAVVHARDKQTVKRLKFHAQHLVGRGCFYHCDCFSLRAKRDVVREAMEEQKDRLEVFVDKRQEVELLQQAALVDAGEELKRDTVFVKYAFKHFRDYSEEGKLFAMPSKSISQRKPGSWRPPQLTTGGCRKSWKISLGEFLSHFCSCPPLPNPGKTTYLAPLSSE